MRDPSRIFILAICTLLSAASAPAETKASDFNGTWKSKAGNEFKIWALDKDLLRIEFSGIWRHDSSQGRGANTGEGHGAASLDGNIATFRPNGAEDECLIVLKFLRGKLAVTQTGICGFGFNVTAEGTYSRASSREPEFTTGEGD